MDFPGPFARAISTRRQSSQTGGSLSKGAVAAVLVFPVRKLMPSCLGWYALSSRFAFAYAFTVYAYSRVFDAATVPPAPRPTISDRPLARLALAFAWKRWKHAKFLRPRQLSRASQLHDQLSRRQPRNPRDQNNGNRMSPSVPVCHDDEERRSGDILVGGAAPAAVDGETRDARGQVDALPARGEWAGDDSGVQSLDNHTQGGMLTDPEDEATVQHLSRRRSPERATRSDVVVREGGEGPETVAVVGQEREERAREGEARGSGCGEGLPMDGDKEEVWRRRQALLREYQLDVSSSQRQASRISSGDRSLLCALARSLGAYSR